jgi:hypothetical protein
LEALIFRIWLAFLEHSSAVSLKSRAKVRRFGRKQSVIATFSPSKLNFAKKLVHGAKLLKSFRLFGVVLVLVGGIPENPQCQM